MKEGFHFKYFQGGWDNMEMDGWIIHGISRRGKISDDYFRGRGLMDLRWMIWIFKRFLDWDDLD